MHPDRSGGSIERMSALNEAYRTLKDADARREYLLRLEGVEVPKGASTAMPMEIPLDIVEAWFEIQEASPAELGQKIAVFENELMGIEQSETQALRGAETAYDAHPTREVLEKIAKRVQSRNYLRSLQRDVKRMKDGATDRK